MTTKGLEALNSNLDLTPYYLAWRIFSTCLLWKFVSRLLLALLAAPICCLWEAWGGEVLSLLGPGPDTRCSCVLWPSVLTGCGPDHEVCSVTCLTIDKKQATHYQYCHIKFITCSKVDNFWIKNQSREPLGWVILSWSQSQWRLLSKLLIKLVWQPLATKY